MEGYPAIDDHGLVGDLQTAALITRDGTVDWFCAPRFDSPSIFAALLDHQRGPVGVDGHRRASPHTGQAAEVLDGSVGMPQRRVRDPVNQGVTHDVPVVVDRERLRVAGVGSQVRKPAESARRGPYKGVVVQLLASVGLALDGGCVAHDGSVVVECEGSDAGVRTPVREAQKLRGAVRVPRDCLGLAGSGDDQARRAPRLAGCAPRRPAPLLRR
ncbi:trehalase-like domain-containing protein [Micromonospora sp. NPDC047548]|uniref:trehalase-like domain-containing protein n=1 Tax=Micromonospora sp. NPDC047548 TaxID=3155624 RepID=UPI0033C59DAB